MSIYDEIKTDHDKTKKVLAQLVGMERPSKQKRKLFEEMKTELTVHLRAEEKVFYERIKSQEDDPDKVLEGFEEHHVADLLLKELSKLDPSDERWNAKLTVLKEAVEHHVEEEEGEIFAAAKKIFSDAEAEEIGEQFVAEKDKRMAAAA